MVNEKYCTYWESESTDPDIVEKEWLEKRKSLLTASDISAALGDNPFKSPIILWREKTGRDEVPDLSDNPNVQYGIENEGRIRDEFMEKNGEWLTMDYNARRIYISKETPFLGATLDGELTVSSYKNPYNLRKGARGVYEGKTFAFKSRDAYESWNALPLHYKEQMLQQMYVTGTEFVILHAELRFVGDKEFQGNLPDTDYRTFIIFRDEEKDATMNLLAGANAFWLNVQRDTKPIVSINSTDAVMDIVNADVQVDVELKAETKIGMFVDNFSEMQLGIMEMVKPFEGLVFTPDQMKDAKKIRADLNKKKKTIDEVRLNLKKEYCKPLDEFEERAKKLIRIIDSVTAPIDAQIKAGEEREKEEKLEKIEDLWEDRLMRYTNEYKRSFIDDGFKVNDPKWLNKTTSLKAISEEIDAIVTEYEESINAIHAQAEGNAELLAVMMNAYADSHKLAFATTAKMRYLATKQQEEERLKAEAEKAESVSKTEEDGAIHAENASNQPENVPNAPENVSAKKEIVFTFKAAHTSAKEWANLIKYMAEHGFRYTQVK